MIIKTVDKFVAHHQLIHPNQTIIVGFSGGPDSTFLLQYLNSIKSSLNLRLIAAHLDHEWRESSINDRNFCEEFCKTNTIELVTARASTLKITRKNTGSKEELGRTLRRAFFQEVKKQYNADSIALAHHLDDQIETFFIRLIRGASVTGLASMRPHQEDYIRPLLCLKKQDILNYLDKQHINFVIDPTNTSPEYLRNRVRLNLVPTLEQIDTRALNSIAHVIDQLQETDNFLQNLAREVLKNSTDEKNCLSLKKFFLLDPFLQKLVLTQWLYTAQVPFVMTTALIDEIMRFLKNTKNTTHHFNQWAIVKKRSLAEIIRSHAS